MSAHYNNKRFEDLDSANNPALSWLKLLKWQVTRQPGVWPKNIANNPVDLPPKRVMNSDLRVANVGHVTFLIQTQGLNLLTDPVWSKRASPVNFLGPKRVIAPGIDFDALPPIDVIWISHNHYDHLDLATINKLWRQHKPRIITPLGNDVVIKAYNQAIEVETYDWGDHLMLNPEITLHLEPMQHWSARGLFDRNKALWAALTIASSSGNIYFVGDSGYGNGRYFKQAKQKFVAFRLALLPIGAYSPRSLMEYAHMDPEDAVKAHIDLGMPYTIPSHYDVFNLADEPYGAALIELAQAQNKLGIGRGIHPLPVGAHCYVPLHESLLTGTDPV